MQPISEDLVQQASRGDAAAVQSLLQRHLAGLHAFVRLRMGAGLAAHESSSDLVQSVCLEIFQHLERYRYRGEVEFKRWLYATALRKLENRRRYHGAAKRAAAREAASVQARAGGSEEDLLECYRSFCTPSRHAAAREAVERIERAFARLSPDHRRVILLARVLGLSRAEVAAEMGRSAVAVRSLLSRALAELAEHLPEAGR